MDRVMATEKNHPHTELFRLGGVSPRIRKDFVHLCTRNRVFATHTDYLDSCSGSAEIEAFRWRQPWAQSRDPTRLIRWIWKSST